jgi:hypothetical protein
LMPSSRNAQNILLHIPVKDQIDQNISIRVAPRQSSISNF